MTSDGPHLDDPNLDFAALLEQSLEDIDKVSRGDIISGTILALDEYGIIVDLGMKRDGVVPRSDIEDIARITDYKIGQTVTVMVTKTEDRDGNLLVSIKQAVASKDWEAAQRQLDEEDIITGQVIAANKGGLIVPYGELRGFVPASHVVELPRGLSDEDRVEHLRRYIGTSLQMRIIEVNSRRRRLVMSQRLAERAMREQSKVDLLNRLSEGDIVTGRVSSLRDFGAFVDLGGADGLIHVSELAWHRVRHPSEIVKAGMEVEACVIQLDYREKRIGLSLKRLQPNPWDDIEKNCYIGQMVEGSISRVVSFGAFVELENGIEALLHISEFGDPPPRLVEYVVQPGDRIRARIINLEPRRQRIGLSIKGLELDMPEGELVPEADVAEDS